MSTRANIYYKSARGEVFNLMAEPLRIQTANFHNYSWKAKTRARKYGVKVSSFQRSAIQYKTKILLTGSFEERSELAAAMHIAFERDIFELTPGRLYWQNYYIDCFIDASSTYPDKDIDTATANEIDIYCPYGFWIKETEYNFTTEQVAETGLDYEYDYEYDYSPLGLSGRILNNESAKPASFTAYVYGPVVTPTFYIAGNMYKVNVTLEEGEYLELDTKKRTIYRVQNNGTRVNEFNQRNKTGNSVFEPIPCGGGAFIWPGSYDVTIVLNEERSEPAWT